MATIADSARTSLRDSTEFSTVRPLPPDLDVVAYQVLQELLLTNALKHGRRDRPGRAGPGPANR